MGHNLKVASYVRTAKNPRSGKTLTVATLLLIPQGGTAFGV